MIRSFALPLIVMLAVPLAQAQYPSTPAKKPQLGAELRGLEFLDSSDRSRSLASIRNGRACLIVLVRSDGPRCEFTEQELQRASSELDALGWVLIPAVAGNGAGCASHKLMRLAPSALDVSTTAAMLVDKSGVLRRAVQRAKAPRSAGGLVGEVLYWPDGMSTYNTHCSRCHGEDGRDTSYPGTKSLAGIGNRHTEAEILEMTQLAGFVDLSNLPDRAKKALAAFVAGL